MAEVEYRENGEVVEMAATPAELRAAGAPGGELGTSDDMNVFGGVFPSFDGSGFLDRPDPKLDQFETMLRRDGKARAIEQVLTLPLRWADMSVEPQDGDSGEAEFVREALTRPANAGGMTTPLELVVGQMTSAVVYRRAFFEKVFDLDEQGRVVYRKLAFRPARTCTLIRDARNRSFDGFEQKVRALDGDVKDVRIKPEKALVYIHGQHRNPLSGASDMDTVWSCFEAKQKVRFLWFQFLERNVIPYGVLKTKEADRAGRVREVAKLKAGGLVGIGEDEALDPFEASGGAAEAFKQAIDWLSGEMSVSVLASFTDLAQQGSGKGSFALSKDQTDFFLRSRQAVLVEMGSTLTNFAAADLARLNFPDAKAPTVVFSDLAGHDAELVKELWTSLIGRAPDPRVPQEFVDYLTELVAQATGMDVDRVRKAIEAAKGGAGTPVGQLQQGLGAAAQLVAEANITANGAPASDAGAIVPAI